MDNAALEARLAALEDELAALRAQVATGRAEAPTALLPAAATATATAAPTVEPLELTDRGTSRRRLLGGAVAGAAAAVTGVLITAEPAAAASGNMQYGSSNDAGTSQTTLEANTLGRVLTVENASSSTTAGGVAGIVTTGIGTDGTARSGIGTQGTALGGVGIRGQAAAGIGGSFQSYTGTAVQLESPKAHLRFLSDGRVPPPSDAIAHSKGELVLDGSSDLWVCTAAGTPGAWRKIGGGTTAGALTLLPAPVRIYDSRDGNPPNVAPQTPLAAAETRTLDTTANSSGVPAGATGLIVNCAVVNAASGDGNFTVWADLVARPKATTMVWGGDTGRCSTLAVTAISPARKIRVASSLRTDVVVDVVGYYR